MTNEKKKKPIKHEVISQSLIIKVLRNTPQKTKNIKQKLD